MRLLLEHKADTRARGLHEETSLQTAVSLNNIEVTELFLNYKAHIEAKNKNNQTPHSNIAKTLKKSNNTGVTQRQSRN